MRQLLSVVLCLTGISLAAQTKKIAFESHSGHMENFHMTLNNEFFDNGESGFGLPPSKSTYKLDSVIFLSDSLSVLVSKEYTGPSDSKSASGLTYIRTRTDTVHNNPLFSRKNSVNNIQKGLKELSHITQVYEMGEKTKLVGFNIKKDKKKPKEDKPQEQLLPLTTPPGPPGNDPPFDSRVIWMTGIILLLSVTGGWITWKYYKPEFQPV